MSVPTEEAVMTVQRFFLSVGETAVVMSSIKSWQSTVGNQKPATRTGYYQYAIYNAAIIPINMMEPMAKDFSILNMSAVTSIPSFLGL